MVDRHDEEDGDRGRGLEQVDEDRWKSRPVTSALIRLAAAALPVAVAAPATWLGVRLLPAPRTWAGAVLIWLGATASALLIAAAISRLAKRLLPLATALQLSLLFPDGAPSRLRLLRGTDSSEDLTGLLARARRDGFSPHPADAVHEILELVRQLDSHDAITRGHGERVRVYTRLIAEEMGLVDDELDRLQWIGLLHDIGKLAVPCHILNKPGSLDEEEWAAVRLHPEIGARMVEPLRGWLGDAVDGVGQHHERWDGAGYPCGLAGEEISLAARIVAVADVFDVITAQRSYKPAQPPEEALREIARCAGTQFDERVVRALLAIPLRRLRLAVGPLAVLSEIPLLGALGGHVVRGVGQVGGLVPATGSLSGAAAVAGAVAGLALPVMPSPAAATPGPDPTEQVAQADTAVSRDAATGGGATADGGSRLSASRPVPPETTGDPVEQPDGDGPSELATRVEPTASATGGSGAGAPASTSGTTTSTATTTTATTTTATTTTATTTATATTTTATATTTAPTTGGTTTTSGTTTDPAASAGDLESSPLDVRDDVLTSGVHSHVRVTDNDTSVVPETVTVIAPATHADKAFFTVTEDGAALLHYHAGNGYTGSDHLTYRACDATGRCATATVFITVEANGTSGGAGSPEPGTGPSSAPGSGGGGGAPAPPSGAGGGSGGTRGSAPGG